MKKFFLFAVAIASISLVSCGDNNNASGSSASQPSGDPMNSTPSMNVSDPSAASVVSAIPSTDVEAAANGVKDAATDAANDLKGVAEQKVNDLKGVAEQKANDLKNQAGKKLNEAQKKAENAVNDAQKKAENAMNDAQKKAGF